MNKTQMLYDEVLFIGLGDQSAVRFELILVNS